MTARPTVDAPDDWRLWRPPPDLAAQYRRDGWWRETTYLDDLDSAQAECGDDVAIVNWRRGSGSSVPVSFGELARCTDRFAGGLRALGVEAGDVVAFYLPSWWEAVALMFACGRLGAVAAPSPMDFGPEALVRLWPQIDPVVCIVPDEWNGVAHGRILADVAAQLPTLRHRVVIGDAAATGAIDFAAHFLDTPWETRARPEPYPGLNADQVAMVVFTSGSSGHARAVLHTPNTLHAAVASTLTLWPDQGGPHVIGTPCRITHIFGILFAAIGVVQGRYTVVVPDEFRADVMLDLCADHRVTQLMATESRFRDMAEVQRERPRRLDSLTTAVNHGVVLPASLVPEIRAVLCDTVLNEWGSTETCGGTTTGPEDPPDWAGRSIGRPRPGVEVRLAPVGDGAASLGVRGPALCVGLFDRADRTPHSPLDEGGWYPTGDLVADDGQGGLRYLGRERTLVGNPLLLPVADIEARLREHPSIRDIAIIDHPARAELCAFVVPRDVPPALADLAAMLALMGLAPHLHPKSLTILPALPRDDTGKIRRMRLTELLPG